MMNKTPQDNNARVAEESQAQPCHYSALNMTFCSIIMRAQLSGNIILPHGLGLAQTSYQQLRKAVNNAELQRLEINWYKEDWRLIRERAEIYSELVALKEAERNELITLLSRYRNQQDPSSQEMAIIVACACLTSSHLWASLGLPTRAQLGELINYNFPKLYALNTKNMRWKRFFYLQLCQQGGDYICKAPSCEECKSYAECFS